jgi:hypothetical protein
MLEQRSDQSNGKYKQDAALIPHEYVAKLLADRDGFWIPQESILAKALHKLTVGSHHPHTVVSRIAHQYAVAGAGV